MRIIRPHNALVAQLDRVLGYEPSGRRFESSRVRHIEDLLLSAGFFMLAANMADDMLEKALIMRPPLNALVAQLDRVLGYEPSGRRFESSRVRHIENPLISVGFFCRHESRAELGDKA